MGLPNVGWDQGPWKGQVGAARVAWGRLTEEELLKTDGDHQKLAGLVQDRYAVSRDEADRQVKSFFELTHLLARTKKPPASRKPASPRYSKQPKPAHTPGKHPSVH